jgi:hypothetical protein
MPQNLVNFFTSQEWFHEELRVNSHIQVLFMNNQSMSY